MQERIQDEIPGATVFESLWIWSDTPAGQLMMVDGRKTLVSALVDVVEVSPSDPRAETAIWDEGETNSLVAVLKPIVTGRLDTADPDPLGRATERAGVRGWPPGGIPQCL